MKSVLNGLLLVLNLVLVAAVVYVVNSWPDPRPMPAMAAPAQTAPPPEPETPEVVQPEVITVTNDFRWAQLESEDYLTYIQRLRTIGCPEQTIRDIIVSDLDKLLAPRMQAIYSRKPDLKYWESEEEERANNFDQREWARQEKEIERQKGQILEALLGVDLVRERLKAKGYEDYYERRLGWLPEDKRSAVRKVLERYDEQEQQIRAQELDGDDLSWAERGRIAASRREQEAELSALLTPAERQQYELWMSPTANTVRYNMYGMDATEQEFTAVYQLRRAFDQQWDPEQIDWNNETTVHAWQQARAALDDQIRQSLGEQRYWLYRRGEDPDFHHLNAAVSRYKLPRQKAEEAYDIKHTVQQMSLSLSANPDLTPPQREEALKAVAAETEITLRQLLGNAAYRHFLRQSGANWAQGR